jgi:hypothetical protein
VTVAPTDLATYLGVGAAIDTARATYLVAQATALCQSIVNPLPAGSDAVVLDVAARAYSNPSNAQTQSLGPFSATFGAAGGGLWLTRQNKATLRRLNGGGSAFSIDTTPAAGVAVGLPFWDWDINAAAAAADAANVAAVQAGVIDNGDGTFTIP